MDQQRAKEFACLLALRRGISLFSRGHFVYGMYADGVQFLVCGSHRTSDLWGKAARHIAVEDAHRKEHPPKFSVTTPTGVFEAHTWLGLLWNWLVGRRATVTASADAG